jgi:hypothetical protein
VGSAVTSPRGGDGVFTERCVMMGGVGVRDITRVTQSSRDPYFLLRHPRHNINENILNIARISVKLITLPHNLPRLRMSANIPLFPHTSRCGA